MHQVTRISNHSGIYRGFTITRLPRNKVNKITRYWVSQNNQSFGLFDAQALATGYIDKLYNN